MTQETLLHLLEILAPAAAAYVSVRVTLAEAMQVAKAALSAAERAHLRIDDLLKNKSHQA